MDEARRNLEVKRPEAPPRLTALRRQVRVVGEGAPARLAEALAAGLLAQDGPILAAEAQAGAEVLATGDVAHFGSLFGLTTMDVLIVPPKDAIARLS